MISVILSTFNKCKFLDLTLAGFALQSLKDFELVIVDDGSTDDTGNIVEKYKNQLDILYIKFSTNKGIAESRNFALANARYDYIIIVDDDRIPCPDFLNIHYGLISKNKKLVSIGKQGRIVSLYDEDIAFDFHDSFKIYNSLPELLETGKQQLFHSSDLFKDFSKTINKYFLSFSNNGLILDLVAKHGAELSTFSLAWSKAFGGNIGFCRELIMNPVSYDNNYIGYGMEDIDLSYQLFQNGFKFVFNDNAINYHQEHKRSPKLFKELYKNFQYFCSKFNTLEVFLMKLDWDGRISLDEANSLNSLLYEHQESLLSFMKGPSENDPVC